jgi:hypothetical protein
MLDMKKALKFALCSMVGIDVGKDIGYKEVDLQYEMKL